jgi:uridine kinase
MQYVAELDSGSIDRLGGQGNVLIVGLAGASGSGKSTVAKRVASRLKGHVISMERYSIVMNDLTLEERAKQNYDALHAIDVKLLESHIRDYAAGHAIEVPHLRLCGTHSRERPEGTPSCIVVADCGRHSRLAFCATSPVLQPIHLLGSSR